MILFVAVAAYPTAVAWISPEPRAMSARGRANLQYLQRVLPRDAVVVSDAPWAVSWYGQRPAVWLPLGYEDFEAVQRRVGVDAIYFTTLLVTYPASEAAQGWQRIYAAQAPPPGFEVAATLPPGELLMLRTAASPE